MSHFPLVCVLRCSTNKANKAEARDEPLAELGLLVLILSPKTARGELKQTANSLLACSIHQHKHRVNPLLAF